VKDRSLFENRFLRRIQGNKQKILKFLVKDRGKKYCDDCLSLRLEIFPRQSVNQICRALYNRGIIFRESGYCDGCGRNKLINYVKLPREGRTVKTPVPQYSSEYSNLDEERIRRVISNFLRMPLFKEKLSIFGKEKEFDIVNIEEKVVGDIKIYRYSGSTPSAEFSTISEYVWLMEKLEASSQSRWRKIIVGSGKKEIFEKYAKNYHPWLSNVEIYFVNDRREVFKIRDSVKLYT